MLSSRSVSQGSASATVPSIDAVRQRARHRLIGAAVLVLLGVVGFSLLLDTQPRPLPVDIPIEIPSRSVPAVTRPLAAPAVSRLPDAQEQAPNEVTVTAPSAPAVASVSAAPVPVPPVLPDPPARAPVEPKPVPSTAVPPTAEGDRARALLEGQNVPEAQRLVVQVGAFSDAARAQEARLKLERAGLKTYTHVAETAQGKRIRVRVGPFSTRAEADKAAARVKALGLPAVVLAL